MKLLAAAALLFTVLASGPSRSYFTNLRDMSIKSTDRQNYLVVDEEIWNHARPDLGDLRIYDNETQAPYVLVEQRGGTSSEERPAKILNLGVVNGHTVFDLDAGEIPEYDRIRLELEAKDFVATASVEGRNALGRGAGTTLGSSTLYDFSRENLGSNSVLKLPTTSFRYLHVRLSPGIRPQQVKSSAHIFNLQEKKAAWTAVGTCHLSNEQQRYTTFECALPAKVPIDRILFQVAAGQVNFRRSVTLGETFTRTSGQGVTQERPEAPTWFGSGEISRIKVNRGGTTVISENLTVNASGVHSEKIEIRIDNGDDPPLRFDAVQPQSIERRVYFEPQGRTSLRLFYGDEKLAAPVYDYAKFFKADPAAAQAELGPGAHNSAYTGRPDDRPWSERHQAVLWIAMLLAVAVLALLAFRGLRAEPQA